MTEQEKLEAWGEPIRVGATPNLFCKNSVKLCFNERRNGSAYCQECSNKFKNKKNEPQKKKAKMVEVVRIM